MFGGTFNPIHLGHLRAAEEVAETLGLDRVVFIPAKRPPHKVGEAVAPAAFRMEVVQRAVADNPRFRASDLELLREGPSYSVDTLGQLRAELGPEGELWFLVGSDAFREIHTWHRYEQLFSLTDLAVMSRPPDGATPTLPPAVADSFVPERQGYRHRSGHRVRSVSVTLLDISSTSVRRALLGGRSIRYLVPDAVRPVLERAAADHPEWFAGSTA